MAIRAIATDSQDFNNPSTTGKPGRDERLDFKNEAGDTVFSIVSDADGTAALQGDGVDGLLTPTPREITAASGNVTAADNGGVIVCNRGTAQTITVDPDLGMGFNCLVIQIGAGQVTFDPGSGVTLNNADSFLAISAQYGAATLYAYAADTFYLGGQLA